MESEFLKRKGCAAVASSDPNRERRSTAQEASQVSWEQRIIVPKMPGKPSWDYGENVVEVGNNYMVIIITIIIVATLLASRGLLCELSWLLEL